MGRREKTGGRRIRGSQGLDQEMTFQKDFNRLLIIYVQPLCSSYSVPLLLLSGGHVLGNTGL